MRAIFDIVDLLQLQEIWVWRPITQAYSRLERRQTAYPCAISFDLKTLMPRLARLRRSLIWNSTFAEKYSDPSLIPLCALTDTALEVLFPDRLPVLARQQLFSSVYNHFVMSRFEEDAVLITDVLANLAAVRSLGPGMCLDEGNRPLAGSDEWIPIDLTDEIRNLDDRYHNDEPGHPAAYVVADDFWQVLARATTAEVDAAVASSALLDAHAAYPQRLTELIGLAQDWSRTSSVVGLYYQKEGQGE